MAVVFVGDVGTEIILDCGTDVSSATIKNIVVRKPNGNRLTWGAVFDGANSIKHVTVDGDLDMAGTWHLQASVTMPTWRGVGDVALLVVKNKV